MLGLLLFIIVMVVLMRIILGPGMSGGGRFR